MYIITHPSLHLSDSVAFYVRADWKSVNGFGQRKGSAVGGCNGMQMSEMCD